MTSSSRLSPSVASELTRIAASGAAHRGPSSLCSDGLWGQAVELILNSRSIVIISGFYVPKASAPETDGPTGAVALAAALSSTGRKVRVWTDGLCLSCIKKCAAVIGLPESIVEDASSYERTGDADLLIYTERLGRAFDGRYYNMRREDITEWTAPLDEFALSSGLPVIGIGDGGNEVGMGSLSKELAVIMPDYASNLCVVPADVCIPVDVSNWGAYALAAALSSAKKRWLAQSEEQELAMLRELCDDGAVDGVTLRREMSVDGMAADVHVSVLSRLREAAAII
ncbi:aspartate/glutamate/hydantoin racemase [Synergistales bacterium]|nr:aspartate/glutamate/hydantoin racemase [Synergistales bacterium]